MAGCELLRSISTADANPNLVHWRWLRLFRKHCPLGSFTSVMQVVIVPERWEFSSSLPLWWMRKFLLSGSLGAVGCSQGSDRLSEANDRLAPGRGLSSGRCSGDGRRNASEARTCFKTPLRCEAKEAGSNARPQAPKNRRRIRWNRDPLQSRSNGCPGFFGCRERRRRSGIIRRSRTGGFETGSKKPGATAPFRSR
jgi:hypothetical protein